ncbi:peptidylprolyl isomerase [Fulvivirgaceae bacterium BMA10]|uniref:Peptidyl-prolyl cis-trans isomerase n=1 Tax=Splendidivirga corallicola TaxID=3051826 RepID=A0ABT8KRY0_9BACT|nr:peptidylprolyl isomerase [Fulvivirgaceae bacterium BMA10]
MKEVKLNDTIKVHYTGKLNNGNIFDSSENREPLQFIAGQDGIIQGFNDAVLGMKLNETKTVTIPSEQAYGARKEEFVQEVSRAQLPPDMQPKIGDELMAQAENGQSQKVKVIDVTEESVKIDYNHPLAGEDLTFEIKVVEIQ